MKPTYTSVRLGKLLLSAVNDKFVARFLIHVALNPMERRKGVELAPAETFVIGLLTWYHWIPSPRPSFRHESCGYIWVHLITAMA